MQGKAVIHQERANVQTISASVTAQQQARAKLAQFELSVIFGRDSPSKQSSSRQVMPVSQHSSLANLWPPPARQSLLAVNRHCSKQDRVIHPTPDEHSSFSFRFLAISRHRKTVPLSLLPSQLGRSWAKSLPYSTNEHFTVPPTFFFPAFSTIENYLSPQ